MLKNDWVMGLCPNVAHPVSEWVSQSVSDEPRYRAAIAAKKYKKDTQGWIIVLKCKSYIDN